MLNIVKHLLFDMPMANRSFVPQDDNCRFVISIKKRGEGFTWKNAEAVLAFSNFFKAMI
jgi:hypothetical protein